MFWDLHNNWAWCVTHDFVTSQVISQEELDFDDCFQSWDTHCFRGGEGGFVVLCLVLHSDFDRKD